MTRHPLDITVGKILKPHGIKGYVRVFPTTDHPERFRALNKVRVIQADQSALHLTIEKVVLQSNAVLIKFAEISTRNQAETLRNARIVIDRSECLPLEKDSYYIFELVGCRVFTTAGEELGTLEEVWEFPANDVYVVRKQGREILIPAVAEFVKLVDIENQRIEIEPVDGLIPE